MKRYMTFIAAVLCIGMMITAASAQKEIDYTKMVEDTEIMSRIIDKTMKEAFKEAYVEPGFFRRGCQGFYLKGYGVVFLVDVQFPVSDKQVNVVKTEKKETNLWERYEREVRNQPQPEEAKWVTSENKAYDEDKVDRLKERLATVVGEYGARIGQLESDDMISVVVFGRSGRSSDFVLVPNIDKDFTVTVLPELDLKVIQEEIIEEKVTTEREKENAKPRVRKKVIAIAPPASTALAAPPQVPAPFAAPTILGFGPYSKPATTLILTFNRSLLEGKKGSDWEGLLKDAQIVQY